ncbi:MAG TPA: proteasome assembly chaperone family protein [Pyrodictium sp.]|nr:proteasome assembly chaperone family protein [Pyrodictium sp.]HIQ55681.1 proteasome assembly chaperone family protein [Pyrodictium sp.]
MSAMREFRRQSIRIIITNDKLFEEFKEAENSVFISGFKGYGMVGYITVVHIVEHLGCERAGIVVTKYMPEAITVDKSGIVSPFELYVCRGTDKVSIMALVNHDLPDVRERTRYADAIIRWAANIGVNEAVFFGGFDARYRTGDEKLRWVATSMWTKKLKEPKMESGLYIIGPLALFTLFSEIYKLPALVILPYAETSRPDPRAAAIAVETFAKLYGLNIDTKELYEKARLIEEKIMELEEQKEVMQAPPGASERVYM